MTERFFVDHLGLTKLEDHWMVLIGSTLFFQLCYSIGWKCSMASPHFTKLNKAKKSFWAMYIVSAIHATGACLLAIPIFFDANLSKDRFFGYSAYAGNVYAISCGYFLWDVIAELSHGRLGFIVHGVTCFCVYFMSFRPFLQFYGSIFLMYEISTLFLDVHRFFERMDMVGSNVYKLNGVLLLTSFFLVRICFGYYQSGLFMLDCLANWHRLPHRLTLFYFACNLTLNVLNAIWFYKMIRLAMTKPKHTSIKHKSGKSVKTRRDKTDKKIR